MTCTGYHIPHNIIGADGRHLNLACAECGKPISAARGFTIRQEDVIMVEPKRPGYRRNPTMLRLEGFPGSSIQDIAEDMIAKARTLDVIVQLNMNGVEILAFPWSAMSNLEKQYRDGLEAPMT